MFTPLQYAARSVFSTYVRILEDYGLGPPRSPDIDHSALLGRLLSGDRPLPIPPPTFYSYPCYALGEGKEIDSPDIHTYENEGGDDELVIGQNSRFKKIDDYTVRYTLTGEIFRFDKPIPTEYSSPGYPVHPKYGAWPKREEFLHMQKVRIFPKTVRVRPDLKNHSWSQKYGEMEVLETKRSDGWEEYYRVKLSNGEETTVGAAICEILTYETFDERWKRLENE